MDTPPFETMNLRYVKNENHLTFFEITLDEAVHSLERVIAPQLVSQFECSSSDGRQFSTECGGGERMLFSLLCGLRSLDWTSDSQRSYSVRSLPGQKHAVESQFFFQRPHSESAALPLRASQVSQGVQRSSASGGDGEKMILRHAQAPADCASAVSALPAGVAESAGGSTTAVKKEKRRSVDEDKMVFFSVRCRGQLIEPLNT